MERKNSEDEIVERRRINLFEDHDILMNLKFQSGNLADIDIDHEKRIRIIEGQQYEWKGALKTWGIIIILIQLGISIIFYFRK